MKKILIVGGSGFIGKNIIETLSKSNKYNILTTFCKTKNDQISKKNIRYLKFDFKTDKNFNKFEEFDPHYIFFLAWNKIPNFSKKVSHTNYISTMKFFEKAKNFKSLKSIVYFGSCLEVLKSRLNYNNYHFVDAKLKLKKDLNNLFYHSSVNIVWLRLFYVYGPFQRLNSLIPSLIDSSIKKKKYDIKNPKLKNDFIHISDIINVLKIIISSKNVFKVINLKTNSLVSVGEVAVRVKELFNNMKINKKNLKFDQPSKYPIPISKNRLYKIRISLDKGIKSCF